MKTRKDLVREYREREKPAGVFQIKNTVNGKVLLGSSLNLEGPLNSHKFMLTIGGHRNRVLQQEWNTYGSDAFVFEILEQVKITDDPNFNIKDELTLLEQIWIGQLQPFGDRGYNVDDKIRQAYSAQNLPGMAGSWTWLHECLCSRVAWVIDPITERRLFLCVCYDTRQRTMIVQNRELDDENGTL